MAPEEKAKGVGINGKVRKKKNKKNKKMLTEQLQNGLSRNVSNHHYSEPELSGSSKYHLINTGQIPCYAIYPQAAL